MAARNTIESRDARCSRGPEMNLFYTVLLILSDTGLWVPHAPEPTAEEQMTLTLVNPLRDSDRVTFTTYRQDGSQANTVSLDLEPRSTVRILANTLFDASVSHASVDCEGCDVWWSYDPAGRPDQPLFEPSKGSLARVNLDKESSVSEDLNIAVVNTSTLSSVLTLTISDGIEDLLQTQWTLQPLEKKLLTESDFPVPGHVFVTLESDQSMAVLAAQRSTSSKPQSLYPRAFLDYLEIPLYTIADPILSEFILDAVDRSPVDGWISTVEAISLQALYCDNLGIQSLDGLQHFVGLEWFWCARNQITHFDALSQLTNLKVLNLSDNPVDRLPDFEQMNGLESLALRSLGIQALALDFVPSIKYLDLSQNPLDVTSLRLPPRLIALSLYSCNLDDVTLSHPVLEELYLGQNQITSLALMMPKLHRLYFYGNRLVVMPDLSGLPALTTLYASHNELIDASFSHDTVRTLTLDDNSLTDIEFLLDLPSLERVRLHENLLGSDQCPTIQTLQRRDVWVNYVHQTGYTLDCTM